MASDFYLRYYVGHKGKFGHEFLEFEFRPDGESGTEGACGGGAALPEGGYGAWVVPAWFNARPLSPHRKAALRQQQQLQERCDDPQGGEGG